MGSSFVVRKAAGYEQLMGRWSRKLAPQFIDFAGLGNEDRVLDVGCGTGSLTFALGDLPDLKEIQAIDFSPVFVEEARRRNSDPRIEISQGDACALPFEDGRFDAALSLLVLHFVPETGRAVSQMRRVVRSGGVVAAAVWDHLGGMPGMRMMWDTVAMLGEEGRRARHAYLFQPMMRPGELADCFAASGLLHVEDGLLVIRMDYRSFDDYWAPIASGEGPIGRFVTGLGETQRAAVDAAVRDAYEGGEPDGPRSFAAVAFACRGRVP